LGDRSVEHVSATVNGAKTRETLRETAKTINGIEERRVTIFAE
jgi:hypothetical protein